MRRKQAHQYMYNNSPGFTLIEVLITLVIIAIVAALSTPAILTMAPSMTLKSAAQQLYSDIQETKIKAIKENRDVGIHVGSAGYTIGEPFTDANLDGLHTPAEVYTDTDGNGAYTADKTIIFANEYEYGIGLGTGNATADWNDDSCGTVGNPCNTPAAVITFNSRGLPTNGDSAFLQNENTDICYALTVSVAGAVKTRKYSGSATFDEKYWVE